MAAVTDEERTGVVPLHGRASVLAQVAAGLDAVEQGEVRALFIMGAPGMGKSAVLDAAIHRAKGRGFRIVQGRSVARDTPVPFDLVRNLLPPPPSKGEEAGPADPRAGLPVWLAGGESAGAVSGFPSVAVLSDDDVPLEKRILNLLELERSLVDLARRLLYAHLVRVLLGEDPSSPVLVAVDDLHHADRDSLDFLRVLMGGAVRRRMMLVAALDPETLGGGARGAMIETIRKGPGVETVSLSALSLDEAAETLRELRPDPPPSPEYIRAVHQRSKGVPAVLEQLALRYPGTTPAAEPSSGEPGAAGAMPFRSGSIPEETLRILTYGAVIGRQFDLALLGRTLHRRSAETLEPLLAPLVDNGTLRRRGRQRYEFATPSVRQELYTKLTDARRRLMHRNVARALEIGARPSGPELFEVAWHYHLAGETVLSVDYSRRAAEVAGRQFAYDEARIYLERALDSLRQLASPRPETERAVRIALGHVLGRIGKVEEAFQVLEALRDPAVPAPLGASALEYLFVPEVRPDLWGHAVNARAVAERSLKAFQATGQLRWLAVAHRGLGVAAWSLADPSAAEEHHRAAAELARQSGDARLEGQSLLDRAHLVRLLDPNGLALSRRLLTDAIERLGASGDAEWQARAYLDRSAVLRSMGRLADALTDLTAAADQATRSGSPALEIWVQLRTARVLVEEGRTGRARKTLERLRQLGGESPRREVEQQLAFITGMLQEKEGRLDKARALFEKSLTLATEANAPGEAAEVHRRLAEVETKLGRPEEAHRHLEEAQRLVATPNLSMPDPGPG